MYFIRYISIIGLILFSIPVQGQKWERLAHKFNNHYDLYQYAESLDDALKVLKYSTRRLDSADIRFMLSYYNVALAYHGLEELELAKTNIKAAYELMVPYLSYDPNFAKVSELYGRIETELGYHKSAELLLANANDIKIQVYGKESYEYMRSLYFMADLEMARSRWEQMAATLEEALEIHERLFQKNLDYARYANYLGLIYMNNGYNQEAAMNFERALSVYSLPGVVKNLTFGNANNNLALIYYYQSDYEHAAIHFEKADSIYHLLLKDYSENYMMLLNNIASLYYNWGKAELAREAYQQLDIYLNENPDRLDLSYIQGIENLAHYHANTGELGISEKFYEKAIKIRRSVSPMDILGLARIMQSLASVYSEGARPDLAAEVALESYNILRDDLPEGDPELFLLLSFLGESYFDSNQVEKAIYFYQLALEQIDLAEKEWYSGELPAYFKQGIFFLRHEMLSEARSMFESAKKIYHK